MLSFSVFKNALLEVKHNKLDYLFIFFQLIVLSDLVVWFLSDSFLFVNLIISLSVVIHKNKFNLDECIFFFFMFIVVFALIPIIAWGFDINLYGGYVIRLITALLIIQYFRNDFFKYYENSLFILSYISLFFFIVQQFMPHIFNIIDYLSGILLAHENYAMGRHYFLIYFYRPALSLRNSGFMWEPAAFGGVLTWAILFNLYINRFEVNKKLIVLTIAAMTTFSTGFFVYFALILLLFFLQKRIKAIKYYLFLLIFVCFSYSQLGVQDNISMIENKIQNERTRHIYNAQNLSVDTGSYSRIGGFIVNSKYFLEWPFGYGLINTTKASNDLQYLGVSPNSLAKILIQWGCVGIVFMFLSVKKTIMYLKNYYYINVKFTGVAISMIILLGPFIGNPFYRQPLTFAILLLGLFLRNRAVFQNHHKFV